VALALLAALWTAWVSGVNSSRWTRAVYIAQARDTGHLRKLLRNHAERRELFARNITAEASVAIAANRVYDLIVDCDCYPLALPPKRGTRGVTDMGSRQAASRALLNPKTPFEQRLSLLKRYGVRYLYYRFTRRTLGLPRAYRHILERTIHQDSDVLLVLDPAHPRGHAWRLKSVALPDSSYAAPRSPPVDVLLPAP
jgi:hypothetical protein